MTRREIREQIFQILFGIEFYPEDEFLEQLAYFGDGRKMRDEDAAYIRNKVRSVAGQVREIDEMINAVAKGWKTKRMSKADLAIIRLAVYEIKFEEDIPTGVAINEAVELAKKFGTDQSSKFVNGILAKIA